MNLPGELASLNFVDFARHLWKRRYPLLLLPPVVVLLSYLFIRFFMGETFEAHTMMMIRTPPTEILPAQKTLSVEAPVYEDILGSDEILRAVVEDARRAHPEEISQTNFELLRKRFKVKVIATVDTTIRTEYSPVISMSVKGDTREVTYFQANRWMELAVERFGKLRYNDARSAKEAYQLEYDRLSEGAAGLQAREVELEGESRQLGVRMEVLLRLLNQSQGDGKSGLLTQLALVEAALEGETLKGDAADPTRVAELGQLLAATQASVERIERQVAELRAAKATVDGAMEGVRKDLVSSRERMAETRVILTRVSSEAVALTDPRNPEFQGDFLILSRPVMPERRVAPPRTLLAIVVGVAFGALLVMVFMMEWFLLRAILKE